LQPQRRVSRPKKTAISPVRYKWSRHDTVEVVRLDGANGKPLLKDDFTADDQKRLDAIKKDLAERNDRAEIEGKFAIQNSL
jgi:hypothetical protein